MLTFFAHTSTSQSYLDYDPRLSEMFKFTSLAILAAIAQIASADYNVQFALGPNVKMHGLNSTQRITGPAFFASTVPANFQGFNISPFWLGPSGNQTANVSATTVALT